MKIAGVQMDIALGEIERNLAKIGDALQETARAGAQLTVFPECTLTGYCYRSLEEALPHAESVPGPATDRITHLCRRGGSHAVVGLLESDGDRLFNAAVLVGPDGVVGSYRKIHMPFLGIDRFATPGDRPFHVDTVETTVVGMNICYDVSFPESARCMTLLGADLVCLPTNWPPGAQCVAECTISCRSLENAVYFLAVNRVGIERGVTFIGQSQFCAPDGEVLYRADREGEEIFYGEVDPTRSRRKHIVRIPGQHEIDRLADRRPDMYRLLTEADVAQHKP